MTELAPFVAAGGLLLAVVLALLLRPVLRARAVVDTADAADRTDAPAGREANLAILRDQLAELEREHAEGLLADADLAQAKDELQRRLLDEVAAEAVAATAGAPPRGARAVALGLALVIPLASIATYLLLGQPDALDPVRRQARVAPQQIEQMLARLEARLKSDPGDAKGWVMLARSYKVLGRYAESAEAYAQGGALVDGDAALLADYAEVLARAAGSLTGKPAELVARALKIDADEPQALFLAGAAASDANDFAGVAQYWGRLLKQVDPASEEGKSLAAAVAKAREIVAQGRGKPAGDAKSADGKPTGE
jgi:cytochrome c-type biogenesis protein CcmH